MGGERFKSLQTSSKIIRYTNSLGPKRSGSGIGKKNVKAPAEFKTLDTIKIHNGSDGILDIPAVYSDAMNLVGLQNLQA